MNDSFATSTFGSEDTPHTDRLLRIASAIADAVSAAEVFEALVDRTALALEASSMALWLLGEDEQTVTLARAYGYAPRSEQQLRTLRLDAANRLPLLDSIARREPIWIASREQLLALYPDLRALVSPNRAYRAACLPLVVQGRALGCLGLTIEREGAANEDEKEFLLLTARYASQAVERLRLYEAERRNRAEIHAAATRLAALNRVSRVLAESELDLASRLRTIVAELGAVLASAVSIFLLEADGLLHAAAFHHPIPEAHAELQRLNPAPALRVGEGLTGSVAATGKSASLASIPADAAGGAPAYSEFSSRFPPSAAMAAALRSRGRVVGVVSASRVHAGESYTSADLELLEELAERAALAIDNARLHAETLVEKSRVEQLYKFAQAVVAADRVEVVFEAALSAIEEALHTKRLAILTYGADPSMRFRAWRYLSEEYRNTVEGHSPWPRDASAPEPVLVADARSDPTLASFQPLFEREGIGAMAFIPLVARGQLLGKFMVYYGEPHAFAPHDVDVARAIANHLASVILRFSVLAQLEETVRHNELFAGVLAHDLRNPLGAIMTAAQLVLARREQKLALLEDFAQPVERILTSGRRMTAMIDQLLDFTRARSGGGITIRSAATNLDELCTHAIDELLLANPSWHVQRETTGDLAGDWDPDRLLQVISNLVANAGQHGTPRGQILVRLDGSETTCVRLEVHNGGAIPAPMLPELFAPFRSARYGRDHARGLGLGLFIVREIVRAHNGRVEVQSSPEAGTTFSLYLPR
ncbi:MAG: GAF domain-containing protein [Myxococcota bacterium]